MPQPTQSDVHVDAILTQMSVAYIQSQAHFIASQAFPLVKVQKQSDKYFKYTKNDWFRDEATRRADTDESAGSGYTLGTDNYSCDVWAFHKDVGIQVRKNSDAPLDPDRDATMFVTQRLLLRQEIQWATDYFTTGVWGTDYVGTTNFTQWSDYAGSDPINDIEFGKESVLAVTGFEANTLVLGYQVFRQLRHHPDIVDRYKYTSSQVVTAEMLAKLFEVERVLVAKAIKATNLEGDTPAYAFVHGKSALLCYVAPNPGILTPSAGYIFAWDGISDGLGSTIAIATIPMPLRKADRIEGEIAFADKVVAADLGFFFSAAVA